MSTQRSDAQIEASRINGALSRGPVTEEGKASSSRNATRHGLLSNTILIAGESRADFDRLLASLTLEFEPQSESELLMIEEMAVTKWRQIRTWNMVAGAHNHEMECQPEKSPEVAARALPARAFNAVAELNKSGSSMDSLHRYDSRFSRQYDRLYTRLSRLKDLRRKQRERELQE